MMIQANIQPEPITIDAEPGSYHRIDEGARELAQKLLDREDEDWTFIDPEDVKRLARAVLAK